MPERTSLLPSLQTETQAARYLSVSRKTLERWRSSADGPPFIRVGSRSVRYSTNDLDAWIASRRRNSLPDERCNVTTGSPRPDLRD
jgi:excisionase family DNA binding protein